MTHTTQLQRIGWREWLALPELDIPSIKVKVDTGARTSALHTFFIEPFREKGAPMVRFKVHPFQRRDDLEVECCAAVADQRWVSDSGGHKERRYVICTTALLGESRCPIELTLTNRDTMQFRMLLGRTAMAGRFSVDPGSSYVLGKPRL